mgnify:CR=1 FL=1
MSFDLRTDGRVWARVLAVLVGVLAVAVLVNGFVAPAIENADYGVSVTYLSPPVLQNVGFVAVALAAAWLLGGDLVRARIPTRADLGWTALALAGSLSLLVVVFVLDAVGVPVSENAVSEVRLAHPVLSLYLVPVALFFVGPGEELVFRGVVQGIFRRAYGENTGILLGALVFGAFHLLAITGPGQFVYVGVAALIGALYGYAYERTGNVVVVILAHGGHDAVTSLLDYVTTLS